MEDIQLETFPNFPAKRTVGVLPTIVLTILYKHYKPPLDDIFNLDVDPKLSFLKLIDNNIIKFYRETFIENLNEEERKLWSRMFEFGDFEGVLKKYKLPEHKCKLHTLHKVFLKSGDKKIRDLVRKETEKYKLFYMKGCLTNLTERVFICPCCGNPI